MTTRTIVFVHSPFVGPSVWRGVSEIFRERGATVVAPALLFGAIDAPRHYAVLAQRVATAVPHGEKVALVLHSGAGSLWGAFASTFGARFEASVFVDAVLPHPGRSWLSTLPAAMREYLVGLACEGLLPPWDRWFPPTVVEQLIADREMRADFIAALPRAPLSFANEIASDGADDCRCGYLKLSDGYAREADEAQRLGWPVKTLKLNHLALLTDPVPVASAVGAVLNRLGSLA